MTNELTELVFILDESGSMEPYVEGTLECVNRVIREQREKKKKAMVTVSSFSTVYQTLFNKVDIDNFPILQHEDYRPYGGTALLDAIGTTITNVMAHYEKTAKNERPKKVNVIVTILTDGQENMSRVYDFDQIRSMIEKYQKDYSWKFVFVGADIDAIAEASKINIKANHAHVVDRSDPNWVGDCAFIMCEEINNF